MFETMSVPNRIMHAREKTARVIDHLMYLLELHENNAIIVYSDTLSSQIPRSYAANAFNVFQRGLHQFEIVRLCALWDRADLTRESIPTVIELVDSPEVIESLAQETASHWISDSPGHLINPSDDPQLTALEVEAIKHEAFGQAQAQRARNALPIAIANGREILTSPSLASVRNLRDKHLAHSLSETWLERKIGDVAPMKYGDERILLNASLPIMEAFHLWVNGTSFSFEESRQIDRSHAEALWKGCKFEVLR